jgi:hypothetical protein
MPGQAVSARRRYLDGQAVRHLGLSEHYHVQRPEISISEPTTVEPLADWMIPPEADVI